MQIKVYTLKKKNYVPKKVFLQHCHRGTILGFPKNLSGKFLKILKTIFQYSEEPISL